ncbi:hypothetical protein [Paenibacillus beijingensis]|uniref:Uncharacterized protein n=1 Tax=Paenibacillus beijingensis TaxID=1126833 RepID=A0A0D5NIX9_9BACL|nr:hypothetical protein [Paenibacillus beijingensis]AJY74947.1 hypothetical protein VN24_10540 [Paenibacillus beijingensis]
MGKLMRKSSEGVRSRKKRESLLLKQQQRLEEQRRSELEQQRRLAERRRARAELERRLAAAKEQRRLAELEQRLLLGAHRRRIQLDLLYRAFDKVKLTVKTKAAGAAGTIMTFVTKTRAQWAGVVNPAEAAAAHAADNGISGRPSASLPDSRSRLIGRIGRRRHPAAVAAASIRSRRKRRQSEAVTGQRQEPYLRPLLNKYWKVRQQQRRPPAEQAERAAKRRLRRRLARSPCRFGRKEMEVMIRRSW